MSKRTAIVPHGVTFKKRTQVRAGGGWLPRYAMAAASKKTAFRHVWHRQGERRPRLFRFRIMREDGIVIDESLLDWIIVWQKPDDYVYDPYGYMYLNYAAEAYGRNENNPSDLQYWTLEEDVWYYRKEINEDLVMEWSYDTISQIWTVPFTQGVKLKKKFWVEFHSKDSITTWYAKPIIEEEGEEREKKLQYTYKTDDFYNDGNLIKPKVIPKHYEVLIPYWKVVASVTPYDMPTAEWPVGVPLHEEGTHYSWSDVYDSPAGFGGMYIANGNRAGFHTIAKLGAGVTVTTTLRVYSSIPYIVYTRGHPQTYFPHQPTSRWMYSIGGDPENPHVNDDTCSYKLEGGGKTEIITGDFESSLADDSIIDPPYINGLGHSLTFTTIPDGDADYIAMRGSFGSVSVAYDWE